MPSQLSVKERLEVPGRESKKDKRGKAEGDEDWVGVEGGEGSSQNEKYSVAGVQDGEER